MREVMVHISLLGNIAAGKTEVTKILSESLNDFVSLYERDVQNNPYLYDFYKYPSQYALHNQLYFLLSALESYVQKNSEKNLIQDFSLLSCPIFAEALRRYGVLAHRDYSLYIEIWE